LIDAGTNRNFSASPAVRTSAWACGVGPSKLWICCWSGLSPSQGPRGGRQRASRLSDDDHVLRSEPREELYRSGGWRPRFLHRIAWIKRSVVGDSRSAGRSIPTVTPLTEMVTPTLTARMKVALCVRFVVAASRARSFRQTRTQTRRGSRVRSGLGVGGMWSI
jgi:hypothetical protein